ncbi:hypothetical protein BDD12DRAFT_883513 [Trichophaea hybrida]|nr:hypothetical protein BDD12DRAFT_883513 [Trichophaea hybrida]
MPPTLFSVGSTLFPPAVAVGSNYSPPPAIELQPSAYHSVHINSDGSPTIPILQVPSTTEHDFIKPSLSSGLTIHIPANPALQKRAASPTSSWWGSIKSFAAKLNPLNIFPKSPLGWPPSTADPDFDVSAHNFDPDRFTPPKPNVLPPPQKPLYRPNHVSYPRYNPNRDFIPGEYGMTKDGELEYLRRQGIVNYERGEWERLAGHHRDQEKQGGLKLRWESVPAAYHSDFDSALDSEYSRWGGSDMGMSGGAPSLVEGIDPITGRPEPRKLDPVLLAKFDRLILPRPGCISC